MDFILQMYATAVLPVLMVVLLYVPVFRGKMTAANFYKCAFLLINTVYPKVCNTVLRTFRCREFLHASLLVDQMGMECWGHEHSLHATAAAVFTLIYPIGVPAAAACVLYVRRHELDMQVTRGPRTSFRAPSSASDASLC